jgi:hypothetical protein
MRRRVNLRGLFGQIVVCYNGSDCAVEQSVLDQSFRKLFARVPAAHSAVNELT